MRSRRTFLKLASLLAAGAARLFVARARASGPIESARLAVIGDYGLDGSNESAVASRVKTWAPDFILTTGDNNYPDGLASNIDKNIGKHYHDFIYPYTGTYGAGATTNRFFPSLGNHDWNTNGAQPYRNYFVLPGNERYYDFTWGPLHVFVVDSDSREPHGIGVNSTQALWLQNALAAADEPWKLVALHHPPYSSGFHGNHEVLQWPFAAWGATAIMAGHDHHYERILRDGIIYFVNGTGGAEIFPPGPPIPGSQITYSAMHGAMLVDASADEITFQFINRAGSLIDTYTLDEPFTPTHFIKLPIVADNGN
jgi:tartrate-resistant acid phosphatase type 5